MNVVYTMTFFIIFTNKKLVFLHKKVIDTTTIVFSDVSESIRVNKVKFIFLSKK